MSNFENYLSHVLDHVVDNTVKDAMNYSLLAGGKRVRPLLVIACGEGFKLNEEYLYPAAAALEMIHTYSLIHDDLPGMDNDDLRRGKPTNHKVYGEATAILAGDGLLTEAFNIIANSNYPDSVKVNCIKVLGFNAGSSGMVYGQSLDMYYENKTCTLEVLKQVHYNKTGRLFSCALQLGAIVAQDTDNLKLLEDIGLNLGLAFQIQDDILDCTSSVEELGKNVGSDQTEGKATYVSILGLDESKVLLQKTYQNVLEKLGDCFFDTEKIKSIIETMLDRSR